MIRRVCRQFHRAGPVAFERQLRSHCPTEMADEVDQ